MTEKISNYSEKKKKKRAFAFFLLIAAMLLTVGIIAAYYTAVSSDSGSTDTGTLTINGEYVYLLNGTEIALDGSALLNPGDILVVRGTITNTGNQSAWLREIITFSASEILLPYLTVYSGELDAQDISGGTGTVLPLTDGTAKGSAKVIPSANDETLSGGGFTYLPTNEYSFAVTIHFDFYAPNETQNQPLSISVAAQALQFLNNNSAIPDESMWPAVTP